MFLNMFFFPICPKDIYANIVGESMHDIPLIFKFYLFCVLENMLAVYRLLLWITSFVLWSCTSGTLGRITGFQGEWSAGWSWEVAKSRVKRLCIERGGQHPDFEGTAVVKGWDWTAWISISALSEQIVLWPPAKIISAALSCCQPWPSNPKNLLHNSFSWHLCLGNANLWNNCPYTDTDYVLRRVEDWGSRMDSCHLKLRKQQRVKHIVLSAQYSTYCFYLSSS